MSNRPAGGRVRPLWRLDGAAGAARLPVAAVLPALVEALERTPRAVLTAPPGAGKTTLVPLALLDAHWRDGRKIVLMEPRRVATRAAAARMAELLGEPVGRQVGYSMRFERVGGPETAIEVVTEGVLVRRLQRDPGLADTAAVIFDEFHERSLDADLGLALCLEAQEALRPDLRLIVMSATLDTGELAAVLGDAPIIRSDGRQFPVAVEHLGLDPSLPLEERMRDAVLHALARQQGGALAFLPGAAEIRRTAALLDGRIGDALLLPLMGELDRTAQDMAISPPPARRRKVVLATNIAETSLTIEGIGCVVDGGLERRPRFSPRTGMTRLVTMAIARSSAEQRRGRAGRLGPGLCLRLGTEAAERARPERRPAEIEDADLAPMALELAAWGAAAVDLRWITSPPPAAMERARELLSELGALDAAGRITERGRAMSELPLHPRLARMVVDAGRHDLAAEALQLAALLASGPRRGPVDLAARLAAGLGPAEVPLRRQLVRLTRAPDRPAVADRVGPALALAYPDRIGQRRGGRGGYRLANGRGAVLDEDVGPGAAPWLVAAELDDRGADASIRLAAALDPAWLGRLFADRMTAVEELSFDRAGGSVVGRRTVRLGRLELHASDLTELDPSAVADVLLEAVLAAGVDALPWNAAATGLRARLAFLHRRDPASFPAVESEALARTAGQWLLPHLRGLRRMREVDGLDLAAILLASLGHEQRRMLDARAPVRLALPRGRTAALDYGADPPVLAARLQDLLGLTSTPAVDLGRVPLTIHILSPAGRPVAVTGDLARFWVTGYPAVRKELRGRYPRHRWPEDPTAPEPRVTGS